MMTRMMVGVVFIFVLLCIFLSGELGSHYYVSQANTSYAVLGNGILSLLELQESSAKATESRLDWCRAPSHRFSRSGLLGFVGAALRISIGGRRGSRRCRFEAKNLDELHRTDPMTLVPRAVDAWAFHCDRRGPNEGQ